MELIDLDEQQLLNEEPQVLHTLLADRTTQKNITWSCDDYLAFSSSFTFNAEIRLVDITGPHLGIIKPRSQKAKEHKLRRTKEQAEVFTPSWVCNAQNNLVDQAWFNRLNVFNIEQGTTWQPTGGPIEFPDETAKSWRSYIDEPRLEITCGEAPYLVSRYDTVTGEPIPIHARIGLLDRKLRIVGENCVDAQQWLHWAERALKATYGFEYQGDSLLLARENILLTYQDYREVSLGSIANGEELNRIANIISWNIWQMNGLTQRTTTAHIIQTDEKNVQLSLFDPPQENEPQHIPCIIMDWDSGKPFEFKSLLTH